MDALHISLPDVALLARVQRAPVSMWLQRYAASATPFPSPAAVRRGQALFDGHQVVDWLETTGRGRNPDARSDLAAFAALAGADLTDDTAFAGLTALLCLGRAVDPLPTDADELLDLADDVDPDDEYLYTEIDALGERAAPLARYAGLLVDAAFSAPAAFEKLMARRTRRPGSGLARTALTAPARHLVAALTLALGTYAEIATPLFVDPSPGPATCSSSSPPRQASGARSRWPSRRPPDPRAGSRSAGFTCTTSFGRACRPTARVASTCPTTPCC